jgi:hypothetical protein
MRSCVSIGIRDSIAEKVVKKEWKRKGKWLEDFKRLAANEEQHASKRKFKSVLHRNKLQI